MVANAEDRRDVRMSSDGSPIATNGTGLGDPYVRLLSMHLMKDGPAYSGHMECQSCQQRTSGKQRSYVDHRGSRTKGISF